jgi:hypothetical protein
VEALVIRFEEFEVPGIANIPVTHDHLVPEALGSSRLCDFVPSIII